MRTLYKITYAFVIFAVSWSVVNCQSQDDDAGPDTENSDHTFYFGADLSYVNQILDKGGVFMLTTGQIRGSKEQVAVYGLYDVQL